MTSATTATPERLQAVASTATKLAGEGWEVVREPQPEDLPETLLDFRPDLLARRGQEHVVVEVKSRLRPPDLDTIALAEAIAGLPGWRLDLIYVPERPRPDELRARRDRAVRAGELSQADPEAGLLLAWSAAEGTLHRMAEELCLEADDAGALLATLASVGALSDDEHQLLGAVRQVRNALAHGRQAPTVDGATVVALIRLVLALGERVAGGDVPA
jgi:hypothetical protein